MRPATRLSWAKERCVNLFHDYFDPRERGEIATTLALIGVTIMVLGSIVGLVANRQKLQTRPNAQTATCEEGGDAGKDDYSTKGWAKDASRSDPYDDVCEIDQNPGSNDTNTLYERVCNPDTHMVNNFRYSCPNGCALGACLQVGGKKPEGKTPVVTHPEPEADTSPSPSIKPMVTVIFISPTPTPTPEIQSHLAGTVNALNVSGEKINSLYVLVEGVSIPVNTAPDQRTSGTFNVTEFGAAGKERIIAGKKYSIEGKVTLKDGSARYSYGQSVSAPQDNLEINVPLTVIGTPGHIRGTFKVVNQTSLPLDEVYINYRDITAGTQLLINDLPLSAGPQLYELNSSSDPPIVEGHEYELVGAAKVRESATVHPIYYSGSHIRVTASQDSGIDFTVTIPAGETPPSISGRLTVSGLENEHRDINVFAEAPRQSFFSENYRNKFGNSGTQTIDYIVTDGGMRPGQSYQVSAKVGMPGNDPTVTSATLTCASAPCSGMNLSVAIPAKATPTPPPQIGPIVGAVAVSFPGALVERVVVRASSPSHTETVQFNSVKSGDRLNYVFSELPADNYAMTANAFGTNLDDSGGGIPVKACPGSGDAFTCTVTPGRGADGHGVAVNFQGDLDNLPGILGGEFTFTNNSGTSNLGTVNLVYADTSDPSRQQTLLLGTTPLSGGQVSYPFFLQGGNGIIQGHEYRLTVQTGSGLNFATTARANSIGIHWSGSYSACQHLESQIGNAKNSICGDSWYNPVADVNHDGKVDDSDVSTYNSSKYNEQWCSSQFQNTSPCSFIGGTISTQNISPLSDIRRLNVEVNAIRAAEFGASSANFRITRAGGTPIVAGQTYRVKGIAILQNGTTYSVETEVTAPVSNVDLVISPSGNAGACTSSYECSQGYPNCVYSSGVGGSCYGNLCCPPGQTPSGPIVTVTPTVTVTATPSPRPQDPCISPQACIPSDLACADEYRSEGSGQCGSGLHCCGPQHDVPTATPTPQSTCNGQCKDNPCSFYGWIDGTGSCTQNEPYCCLRREPTATPTPVTTCESPNFCEEQDNCADSVHDGGYCRRSRGSSLYVCCSKSRNPSTIVQTVQLQMADINGDGVINLVDFSLAQKKFGETIQFSSGNSGTVDAILVSTILSNLSKNVPIPQTQQ